MLVLLQKASAQARSTIWLTARCCTPFEVNERTEATARARFEKISVGTLQLARPTPHQRGLAGLSFARCRWCDDAKALCVHSQQYT